MHNYHTLPLMTVVTVFIILPGIARAFPYECYHCVTNDLYPKEKCLTKTNCNFCATATFGDETVRLCANQRTPEFYKKKEEICESYEEVLKSDDADEVMKFWWKAYEKDFQDACKTKNVTAVGYTCNSDKCNYIGNAEAIDCYNCVQLLYREGGSEETKCDSNEVDVTSGCAFCTKAVMDKERVTVRSCARFDAISSYTDKDKTCDTYKKYIQGPAANDRMKKRWADYEKDEPGIIFCENPIVTTCSDKNKCNAGDKAVSNPQALALCLVAIVLAIRGS